MTAEDAPVEPAAAVRSADVEGAVSTAGLRPVAARPEPREGQLPAGARPARNAVIAVGLITYAWILAGAAPFSRTALVGVLLPGAVLGAIAYGRPPERIPPPKSVELTGSSYWIICIALLFEWEASAFRQDSPLRHPALTDLINPLIGAQPVKCAAIVVWLMAGWALVKR
jgi:hypothetical protein